MRLVCCRKRPNAVAVRHAKCQHTSVNCPSRHFHVILDGTNHAAWFSTGGGGARMQAVSEKRVNKSAEAALVCKARFKMMFSAIVEIKIESTAYRT